MTTCNDTTDGKGGAAFSCKIENLKTYTKYEVTVVSKNSAGESIPTTGFIDFYTYGNSIIIFLNRKYSMTYSRELFNQ